MAHCVSGIRKIYPNSVAFFKHKIRQVIAFSFIKETHEIFKKILKLIKAISVEFEKENSVIVLLEK